MKRETETETETENPGLYFTDAADAV